MDELENAVLSMKNNDKTPEHNYILVVIPPSVGPTTRRNQCLSEGEHFYLWSSWSGYLRLAPLWEIHGGCTHIAGIDVCGVKREC